MTDVMMVRIFWFLALPTVVGILLIVGGVCFHIFTSVEYRRYLRRQKAKMAWGQLMGKENERSRNTKGAHS